MPTAPPPSGPDPRRRLIIISLAVSIVMLTGKLTAYALTLSAAIFADAAESVVHGVATGLAAFSLWYAAKPADRNHPYGHGRIAYFSAGFEGALVLAASIAVLYSGVEGLIHGTQLNRLGVGLAIAAGLALINLVLGTSLIRVGKKHNSLILVANGRHVLTDMWTTAAAILGVGLVLLTGIEILDPVAALVIGLWIMASGIGLVRESFSGLMDKVEPDLSAELSDSLKAAVAEELIVDFHHLRCRQVNDETWVEVHMLVPGDLPVTEAHARVTQVEEALTARFDHTVWITSHIEPADHATAHPGGHPEMTDPLGGS